MQSYDAIFIRDILYIIINKSCITVHITKLQIPKVV